MPRKYETSCEALTALLTYAPPAGQAVSVKVLEVDPVRCRLALSLKQTQADPLRQRLDQLEWVATDVAHPEVARMIAQLVSKPGVLAVTVLRQADEKRVLAQVRGDMGAGLLLRCRCLGPRF